MTTNNVETKVITLTKEYGKKWVVEFSGSVARRELNHLRQLLPVEYARMCRRRTVSRLQEDRKRRIEESMKNEEVKDLPIVETVKPPVTTVLKETRDAV